VYIQRERKPWDKESLGRTAKAKVLTDAIKASKDKLSQPVWKVAEKVRNRKRSYGRKTNEWFVQVFHDEYGILQGWLTYDPCMHYVPGEARRYMNKTKMMQLRIPVELHKWFKKFAQEKDTTMTKVVCDYLEYLRKKYKRNFEDVEQI